MDTKSVAVLLCMDCTVQLYYDALLEAEKSVNKDHERIEIVFLNKIKIPNRYIRWRV